MVIHLHTHDKETAKTDLTQNTRGKYPWSTLDIFLGYFNLDKLGQTNIRVKAKLRISGYFPKISEISAIYPSIWPTLTRPNGFAIYKQRQRSAKGF